MPTLFTPTRAAQTDLAAWQNLSAASYVVGSALDISAMWNGRVTIEIGRLVATAFTSGGPAIRIKGSCATSGNDEWTDLFTYIPQIGASVAATTANGAISANAATYTATSASGITAGDLVFLGHTTTPANYEILEVLSVSSNTITPVNNVVNAHDNGCVITDQAEKQIIAIDFSGLMRIRADIDNTIGGQSFACRVGLTTTTNVTTN